MNCPNCKQLIPSDITVCPYCGTIIPQPEPQPYNPQPQQPVYGSQPQQPVYGTQPQQPFNPQPQQFDFPEQMPPIPNTPQPEPKKSRGASKAVIAVVAVVLVAVIAAVGIFLVSRKGDDTKGKGTSTAQVDGKDSNKKNGLEKIGETDRRYVSIAKGGLYYMDSSDKYGVISFDGENDTGAKYVSVDKVGDYFSVKTAKPKDEDDIDGINSVGLIDGNGEEIIPAEYATYEALNERYIEVCKATEKTESKDDALLFLTDSLFSLGTPDEDDVLYKGSWYIFDCETGSFIPDVTGTKGYRSAAYGGCVQYVTDGEETVVLNGKGKKLAENANVFDNGCYAIDNNGNGTVYDSDGKVLFEYDSDSLVPTGNYGKYFAAIKYKDSGERSECVLDRNGKVVSSEFEAVNYIYGDLVAFDGILYDFDGKKVVDGKFKNFYMDDTGEKYVVCVNDEKIVYLKANGKLIDEVSKKKDVEFESYNLLAYKKIDDDKYYYSFKDKDFSVKGDSLTSWYVETEDGDNLKSLENVMTGKTVLTGYSDYSDAKGTDGTIYICAANKGGKGADIYTVK